jgi:hypothetical protein
LSISQGGLYTLGRHNSFHYNHQRFNYDFFIHSSLNHYVININRTSIFVVILDGFTGVLAGFAIFSVLGYMADRTGVDVGKLAVGGPGYFIYVLVF